MTNVTIQPVRIVYNQYNKEVLQMNDQDYTMRTLLQDARDSLKNDYDLLDAKYPSDLIAECADGFVPVYTSDLLEYGSANWELMTDEPGIGPAFDGSPTPINIIAANIYEAVSNHLHQELDDIMEELQEELEEDSMTS